MSLTDRLEKAWADPVSGEEPFDLAGELDEVLAGVGLSAADAGGAVTSEGADPVVPSPASTPMGRYQGVTDQVAMSATPGHYDPVLDARGAADLAWR